MMINPQVSKQVYSFIYELAKLKDRDQEPYLAEVQEFLYDFVSESKKTINANYVAYQLGTEARDAKEKADSLKVIKKPTTKKAKKEKK
jgi:hypothetical protein